MGHVCKDLATCMKPIALLRGKQIFQKTSVGLLKSEEAGLCVIWLIGRDEIYSVSKEHVSTINVVNTGDKHKNKICNTCHCLKPVEQFARNQTNLHGIIRRPSCKRCRTDVDKRAPKTQQAKQAEKQRPATWSYFKCPICQRRSIAGVTAKVVADHDHHSGNIRDFICDSCNTGLGRFKNGENYLMNAVNYVKDKDALK